MLILAAGWLADVSLAKLIVLLIGAIILVPVIMGILFLIIVGSGAVIAACLSEVPPWVARHACGDLTQWRQSASRLRGRGVLTWGLVLLCTGLALAEALAAGVTESKFTVVTLVLVGIGAGLLISYLVQAIGGRSQTKGEGDTRQPDSPERARDARDAPQRDQ